MEKDKNKLFSWKKKKKHTHTIETTGNLYGFLKVKKNLLKNINILVHKLAKILNGFRV